MTPAPGDPAAPGPWRVAAAAAAVLAAVRARPVELATAFALGGLLAGPRSAAALGVLALAALAFGGRRQVALVLVLAAAALGGATLADVRLAALDRSALGPDLGHAVRGEATLLEPLRRQAFGRRAATVGWGGERVLLRAARGVRLPAARVGDVLSVRGAMERLGPRDGWLRPRSVHAVLDAALVRSTGRRRGGVAGTVDGLRRRAEAALSTGVPRAQAALLRGMALGQDEALVEGEREDFRRSGLSHLLAASGQNVVLLSALALALAAVLGVPLHARLGLVLALIALYVPLAGAGPSIQRAGIMGAAATVALLAGRPARRRHAVLLAAAVTLALNPRAVEEPGWQLSFAAVVAILLLAPGLRARLLAAHVPRGPADATALTVAATLGTAPLIALHFETTSLAALPANVLATPAVAPAMWLSLLAATAGQVWPAAATIPAALAAFPAAYVSWLAHTAARAPLADVRAGPLEVLATALSAAGALAAWSMPRTERLRAPFQTAAAVTAAVIVVTAAASGVTRGRPLAPPPPGVRVSILDVGQGDATLVQHRDTAILVDAGPPDGGVVARLREAGVRRLAALVVTHAQSDHAGGAAAVLGAFDVGLVLDGRDGVREPTGSAMAAAARRHGVQIVPALAGRRVRAGPLDLRLLWPQPRPAAADGGAPGSPAGAADGDDPNLRAVVAELRAGPLSVLLAADAESEVLSTLELPPVDVLKVSHHGSDDPGLPAVLARLRPRVATISVGTGNRYGHPAPATLRALRAAGARVVRTDRDGTVRLTPIAGGLLVQRAHEPGRGVVAG
jgi:competence protein ComEC